MEVEFMRGSQKTENQADRQWMVGLEDQEQTWARSMNSDETTMMSGIEFEQLVLDQDNLNLAYQRRCRRHR